MARIVIHDTAGHPFQVQLSRELARRGHQVLHLYSSTLQTPKGPLSPQPGDPPSFEVRGIATAKPIRKYDYIRRFFQEREYGRSVCQAIREFHPEVVLSGNAQLDVQFAILRQCRSMGVRFHFWIQDVLGIGASRILRNRFLGAGRFVGAYYERKEQAIARSSDGNVVITPDFVGLLESWGVPRARIACIPNWAPLDGIVAQGKVNPWSMKYGVDSRFAFIYTGTLGLKHNPDLLVHLARRFANRAEVLVTSEGPGAEYVREAATREGLDNLKVLGFQDFAVYSSVLGAADVLVAVLEKDAGVMSVPSKVLSYHCAGRPILLSAPLENLSARIVQGASSGQCVPAEDVESFLREAEGLFANESERTKMAHHARQYAEDHFEIESVANHFEEILIPS